MVYYEYSADDVRAQAGQLAISLLDLSDRIVQWKTWLDATPDADLTSAPRSMTSTEVSNIKSAATDMAAVVAGLRGTAALSQADRTVFVRRLTGPATY